MVFAVAPGETERGPLTVVEHVPTGGATPWGFSLAGPAGGCVLLALTVAVAAAVLFVGAGSMLLFLWLLLVVAGVAAMALVAAAVGVFLFSVLPDTFDLNLVLFPGRATCKHNRLGLSQAPLSAEPMGRASCSGRRH